MTKQILLIQGAGSGAHDEDKILAESLRSSLGSQYDVRYPAMPNEDEAPYKEWCERIESELAVLPQPVVLVGHSIGASVLIKWLSERTDETATTGVYLLANPFWGGDGWLYEGYEELELPAGAAARFPEAMPIYLYHCRDDEIVPFAHLSLYAQALPQATVREFDKGGHQFNDDLSAVARDIKAQKNRDPARD